MTQSILYYPNISIDDGTWLRSALLYWDEVCSIVPYPGYEILSSELLYASQRGSYRAIYPENIFMMANIDDFVSAVNNYFRHNYPKAHIRQETPSPYIELEDEELYSLIHYKKLPSKTLELLQNSGIIIDKDGWIQMPKTVIVKYMKLLAELAIKHDANDMVIGTDNVSRVRGFYPIIPYANNANAVAVTLNQCLPVPSLEVSIEEILDFKEQRHDELFELRKRIGELEKDIAQCRSLQQIKSISEDFRKDWQTKIRSSEKMFAEKGIKCFLGSLRAFIAGSVESAGILELIQKISGANLPDSSTYTTIVALGGILGVGAYAVKYQKRIRNDLHNTGFAYIVSANKNGLLQPKNKLYI